MAGLKKFFKKNWVLILLVVLVALRIALPIVGKYAVNWYLGKEILPYTGHIEDFDLSLHRGAYKFQGFVIEKHREKSKQLDPLIHAKEIDVSLAWRALFRGRFLGDLTITEAKITFLDSQTKENAQSGLEGDLDWKHVFTTLVPIDIEDLKIHHSTIAFKNTDFKKPVDVYISQIEMSATNINNIERKNKAIFSDLNLSAKFQDQAPITINGAFDILAKIPAFDLAMTLKNFELPKLNELLLVYGPVSFTSGNVSVYSEIATQQTRVDGYVKAFFKNLDVVAPHESFKSFKHFLYEMVTALGNLLLRDHKKEVAFRVPIEGPITQLSVSTSKAFFSALKNAFKDNKLKEGLEKSISLKNVKPGDKPEAKTEFIQKVKPHLPNLPKK
jgi:hypothetical protein